MKRKILFITLMFSLLTITVYALSNSFVIDSSTFSFSKDSKKEDVMSNFSNEYKLSYNIESKEDETKEKIKELSRKVTYLLLGAKNVKDESPEDYYNRYNEYLELRYDPEIPPGDSFGGFDSNSQEYKDSTTSGIALPGVFLALDERNVNYNKIDSIRVVNYNGGYASKVLLKDIKIKVENPNNPMEYIYENTNLNLYYVFKELKGEYKLLYLFGETIDELDEYLTNVAENESTTMALTSKYVSDLSQIYDFSKLDSLNQNVVNNIYNNNYRNIMMLNSYRDASIVDNANGILISDGLVVTTWSYIEKSLKNAQFITIKDNNNNIYQLDGIVTINPEVDIAIIKLKEQLPTTIKLGNLSNSKVEDPIITISSKLGFGLSSQLGIITANEEYLEHSIPLSTNDEGSPVFNINGEVIGINTAQETSSSTSLALKVDALKEIQEMFSKIDFNDIKTVSFDKLKEDYYYTKMDKEKVISNIPKSKWKTYSQIGDIENTIGLELVKSNYDNGAVSLRYYNGISDYISSMKLTISFRKKLIEQGYQEVLKSNTKYIYSNSKYKVVIMEEFDYLIVVMVKL